MDDAAFARLWVESRSPRYGAARLRTELRLRGVDSTSIDAALTAAPDAELESARRLARRRLPRLRQAGPDRAAARLHDQLLRRGFAPAIVARVLREALDLPSDEPHGEP